MSNEFSNLNESEFYRGMSVDVQFAYNADDEFQIYPVGGHVRNLVHTMNFVSTSALESVARSFANLGTAKGDMKTIFKIRNRTLSQRFKNLQRRADFCADDICVDVSWIWDLYPTQQDTKSFY